MIAIELIGNLGADASVVNNNGASFVAFRVAHSRKVKGGEVTDWYDVTMNQCSEKLLSYLVSGQCVFVRGIPTYRIFDSAKYHCKMVGVTIMANNVELVGAAPKKDDVKPF